MDPGSSQWDSGGYDGHTGTKHAPRRVCQLLIFGIVLPVLFLCLPVYMRFVVFRPYQFHIAPLDMKLLSQESSYSTVWCESQEVRMNGSTFNAFLLPERPKLHTERRYATMKRIMMIPDDVKEYWGFYLLRGSSVHVSVCSRHEGASFIVVRGLKDARKCSYLGELDSVEESDEMSTEFEFNQLSSGAAAENNGSVSEDPPNDPNPAGSPSQEVLQRFSGLSSTSQKRLVLQMMKILNEDPQSEEYLKEHNKGVQHVRALRDLEEDEDQGGERVNHVLDRGRFDQNHKNDHSREETKSSWSSSEEALARCQGLIYNVPLNGATKCNASVLSNDWYPEIMSDIALHVTETGYYYFIFANENEIVDNVLVARFSLHKTVFDLSRQLHNCTEATSCQFDLSFWSDQQLVLQVPESAGECSHGSLLDDECQMSLVTETVCHPRRSLYMVFLLLVPIMILFCANF